MPRRPTLPSMHSETAGAGPAQSRAAGFYPDQLASCGPALSVEDQYRDHGVLGRRTSAEAIIRFQTTKVPGTLIGRRITVEPILLMPSARRNYIPVAFIPKQNPFYLCAAIQRCHAWSVQTGSTAGDSVVQTMPTRAGANRYAGIVGSPFVKAIAPCYAQWEDCGPFRTDHFQYVFWK